MPNLFFNKNLYLPKEFETTLTRQNSLFKSKKEWRLILDRDKPEEMYVEYPSNLIQSIYVGPLVDEDKTLLVVAGWGTTENDTSSDKLLELFLEYKKSAVCESEFRSQVSSI